MAGKVFINYRRARNLDDAIRLRDILRRHFGEARVFLDISGLDGGDHWPEELARQVDEADAMVALICDGWADIRDDKGARRLENPNDFVRVEIARALARKIPFIPVTVDSATMPGHTELPPELASLTSLHAMRFRKGMDSDDDGEKIAKRLREMLAAQRRKVRAWQKIGAGASVGALAVGLAAGWYLAARPMPASVIIQRLGGELDRARGQAENAEAAQKNAQARLAAAEMELAVTAAKLKHSTDQLEAERGKKQNAENELAALQATLAAAETEKSRLQGLLSEGSDKSEARVAELTSELDERKQTASMALAQVELLNQQITELRVQIANLEQQRRSVTAGPATLSDIPDAFPCSTGDNVACKKYCSKNPNDKECKAWRKETSSRSK